MDVYQTEEKTWIMLKQLVWPYILNNKQKSNIKKVENCQNKILQYQSQFHYSETFYGMINDKLVNQQMMVW